jgi:PRC-barrel domain
MRRIRLAGIATALAALLAAPSLAQPAGQPGTPPDQRQAAPLTGGTAQKSQNSWRGRTLVGTAVFNDNGQRIATINDLLITDDGRVDQVVLAVRRMRGKLVTVPFGNYGLRRAVGRLWPLLMPECPPSRAM